MRLAVCSSKGGVSRRRWRPTSPSPSPPPDASWPSTSTPRTAWVVRSASSSRKPATVSRHSSTIRSPRSGPICLDVAPGVDLLPAHQSLESVAATLAAGGGLTTSIRRALRPLWDDYDHVVLDTRGDLGGLTLAAVCAADSVLTLFTSDPGSALGAARRRRLRRTAAGVREHVRGLPRGRLRRLGSARTSPHARFSGALDASGLHILRTRVPMSRRVPSSTLAKRPVAADRPGQPGRHGVRRPRRGTPRRHSWRSLRMTSRPHASTLREDLLADLRQAAPPAVPAPPRPAVPRSRGPRTPRRSTSGSPGGRGRRCVWAPSPPRRASSSLRGPFGCGSASPRALISRVGCCPPSMPVTLRPRATTRVGADRLAASPGWPPVRAPFLGAGPCTVSERLQVDHVHPHSPGRDRCRQRAGPLRMRPRHAVHTSSPTVHLRTLRIRPTTEGRRRGQAPAR